MRTLENLLMGSGLWWIVALLLALAALLLLVPPVEGQGGDTFVVPYFESSEAGFDVSTLFWVANASAAPALVGVVAFTCPPGPPPEACVGLVSVASFAGDFSSSTQSLAP